MSEAWVTMYHPETGGIVNVPESSVALKQKKGWVIGNAGELEESIDAEEEPAEDDWDELDV